MFVYSVKGNTLKLAGIICFAAVIMLSLLFLVPKNDATTVPTDAEDTAVQDAAAEDTSAQSEDGTESAQPTETEKSETAKTPKKQEKINYNRIKTNEDRIKFLEQFGWQVENEPVEEVTVKIPKTFDNVLTSYNNIQLHQGLDLTKYSGKEVSRYTYKVTNYPDYTGNVIANVIVYRNRVIGGDVCSSDVDGFIRDFTFPEDKAAGETAEKTAETPDTSADTTAETEAQ